MWAIHATRQTFTTDSHGVKWRSVSQIPTFYLSENVQGIRDSDHACAIARDILDAKENEAIVVFAGYIHTKAMEGA